MKDNLANENAQLDVFKSDKSNFLANSDTEGAGVSQEQISQLEKIITET